MLINNNIITSSVLPHPVVVSSDMYRYVSTLSSVVTPVATYHSPIATLSVFSRSREINFVESLTSVVPLDIIVSTPVAVDYPSLTHSTVDVNAFVVDSFEVPSFYKETSSLRLVNIESDENVLFSTTELFQTQLDKGQSASFHSLLELSHERSNYQFVSSNITETATLLQSVTAPGRQSVLVSHYRHFSFNPMSSKSDVLFSHRRMVPELVQHGLESRSAALTEFLQPYSVVTPGLSSLPVLLSHLNLLSVTSKSLHHANFSVTSTSGVVQGVISNMSSVTMLSYSSFKSQLGKSSKSVSSSLLLKSSMSRLLPLSSLLSMPFVSQPSKATVVYSKDSLPYSTRVATTRHLSQYSVLYFSSTSRFLRMPHFSTLSTAANYQLSSLAQLSSEVLLSGYLHTNSVPVSTHSLSSNLTLAHLSSAYLRTSVYSLIDSSIISTVNSSFSELMPTRDGTRLNAGLLSPSATDATMIASLLIPTHSSSNLPSTVSSYLCNTDYSPYSCNCFMCHNHCCVDELSETVLTNAVVISFAMAAIEQYQILEHRFKTILVELLELYCSDFRLKCFGADNSSGIGVNTTIGYVVSVNNVNVFEVKRLVTPILALNLAFLVEVQNHRLSINSSTTSISSNGTRNFTGSLQTVGHRVRRNTENNQMVTGEWYVPSSVLIKLLEQHKNNISLFTGYSVINGSICLYISHVPVYSVHSVLLTPTVMVEAPGGQDNDNNLLIILCSVCGGCLLLLMIVVIAVFCYFKQRRETFSPVSQEQLDKDLLQRQSDGSHHEQKEFNRSRQGKTYIIDWFDRCHELIATAESHADNTNRVVPMKQSDHNLGPEKELEHKKNTVLSSRTHSQRIRQILRRGRTCAVGPAFIPDDDDDEEHHRRASMIALLRLSSVQEPDKSHDAWAPPVHTTALDASSVVHGNRQIPPDLRNSSHEHPSSVRTQELPGPRTVFEPKLYNDLQLPRKNSTVLQSPELLQSSQRRLPSLKTPVNVYMKNDRRYSTS
ncbi:uncharacterized protein LOC134186590 isoform X2 [Corticium candelabrum]|uniref:uncharacterized protein LOC134186590 isoform X2 n=1 Tax=Corticium candelabrum TaxID=121492 RepID=UPI002E2647B3|nr:uncharacterized protein LOC134186590 isoform X2 [Corticium candelabrum]